MCSLTETSVACPYCGEKITVLIDASCGSQEYYEDCSVCCSPILFTIAVDTPGELSGIEVRRDDD